MPQSGRIPTAAIDPMFVERWSPRSFLSDPITENQVRSMLEAARWAPSCFNDQPWEFRYALSDAARARFSSALVESNRAWAAKAPLLVFVLARRHFRHNGKRNRHAAFDTGAAWMSFALQARKLGLHTHAMAGFDAKRAYAILELAEEEYAILAAVAVGVIGEASDLAAELAASERPSDRKPLSEVGRPA